MQNGVTKFWRLLSKRSVKESRALKLTASPNKNQQRRSFDTSLNERTPNCSSESKPNANVIINMNPTLRVFALSLFILAASFLVAADYPPPTESDFTIHDFKFASGETLPELRLHYRTLGEPQKDAQGKTTNAVLIMHGTTGSGAQFIRPEFAGELFGKDQPLDATKFFIVLPDGIVHGKSSKPSDGMHAKFPRYGYIDVVEADYRLLTEGLGVNHARLVMGTSMGGMHTWLWGESHPEFMDALMPLASLPTQISGRI